jgi:hypothetical protein
MSQEKYIGLDVHQATIFGCRDGWLLRNISAYFRASIRSLLFPSFNKAAFRGSQTNNR